jgi:hypothetical protein
MFIHTLLIGQILADTIDLRLLAPDRAWASGIRQNQHAIPGEEFPLYTRTLIAGAELHFVLDCYTTATV